MPVRAEGFRKVSATFEEKQQWFRTRHPNHRPPFRVECLRCHQRMWLSGLGAGSHRKACQRKHPQVAEGGG